MRECFLSLFAAICGVFALAAADAQFDEYFSDNIVLQRGVKCPISGTGIPGVEVAVSLVEVRFESNSIVLAELPPYTTKVDENGVWKLNLNPTAAGGPHTILLRADGQVVNKCENVMFGDVFIFADEGGARLLRDVDDAQSKRQFARLPHLRLLAVGDEEFSGWWASTPYFVTDFSAAAFDFGRELQSSSDVAVGVIQVTALSDEIAAKIFPTALRALVYSPADGEEWNDAIAVNVARWRELAGNAKLPIFFDGDIGDSGLEAFYGIGSADGAPGNRLAAEVLARLYPKPRGTTE